MTDPLFPSTFQSSSRPWSLTQLRSRLERGEVSAVAALRASLEKIAADNEELRAFISVREREALREAQEADTARAANRGARALLGVPLAIKDLIDVRGVRTTAASRVLENEAPATEDAECVRRLRAAGAILVGKTNLHEFAYGGSGAVSAFGAARNPLDRARVCGGSSSGSAAAVAAGMCFGALGTRYRRFDPAARGVLRGGWIQADLGRGSGGGSDSAGLVV